MSLLLQHSQIEPVIFFPMFQSLDFNNVDKLNTSTLSLQSLNIESWLQLLTEFVNEDLQWLKLRLPNQVEFSHKEVKVHEKGGGVIFCLQMAQGVEMVVVDMHKHPEETCEYLSADGFHGTAARAAQHILISRYPGEQVLHVVWSRNRCWHLQFSFWKFVCGPGPFIRWMHLYYQILL